MNRRLPLASSSRRQAITIQGALADPLRQRFRHLDVFRPKVLTQGFRLFVDAMIRCGSGA
jgi:hypothetical protein